MPSAAILGVCLSTGQWQYATLGLGQWALNVAAVVLTGVLIIRQKDRLLHSRRSWF